MDEERHGHREREQARDSRGTHPDESWGCVSKGVDGVRLTTIKKKRKNLSIKCSFPWLALTALNVKGFREQM